jgi:hypothetical protein
MLTKRLCDYHLLYTSPFLDHRTINIRHDSENNKRIYLHIQVHN